MQKKDTHELVIKSGLIASHDVEAVEAIYPGTFDESFTRHAPKFSFADPRVAGEHVVALIAADLWEKRGGAKVDENIDARIQAAKTQAEAWLQDMNAKRSAPTAPRLPPSPSHPPAAMPADTAKDTSK